jgi:hypothetical protein
MHFLRSSFVFKFLLSIYFVTIGLSASGEAFSQMSKEQVNQAFVEARAALEQQISKQSSPWHLGEAQTWSADFLEGTLRFRAGEGLSGTAKIQVIGSFNKTDRTFTWGWDHPAVSSAELRKHALLAREWGRKADLPSMVQRKVPSTEQEAWNFAALTNRLANTEGVFRGPSGVAWVFMTLSDIKIEPTR